MNNVCNKAWLSPLEKSTNYMYTAQVLHISEFPYGSRTRCRLIDKWNLHLSFRHIWALQLAGHMSQIKTMLAMSPPYSSVTMASNKCFGRSWIRLRWRTFSSSFISSFNNLFSYLRHDDHHVFLLLTMRNQIFKPIRSFFGSYKSYEKYVLC